MITFRRVDADYFGEYDKVSMRLVVTSEYRITKHDRGLSGFTLTEVPVEPYTKDFCIGDDVTVSRWA
nr:hypothetical protein [Clostridia bacterium]